MLQPRARACDECRPRRDQALGSRTRERAVPVVDNPGQHDLQALIEAIDKMSAIVGRASAHLNKGELTARLLEDWFSVSKEVMVAADPLRQP